LKQKLALQGLFDPEKKRPLPAFPKKIALITALHGAALQDFLQIVQRRSLGFHVVIIPALVQGEQAPASIISGLEKAWLVGDFDVIVLARGGGSLEDLWAFNDERLAYAIAKSPVPTLSAVGHQVDFTIADFVADLRAETPSAAAEILSAPQVELQKKMEYLQATLANRMNLFISKLKYRLTQGHPLRILDKMYALLRSNQKKLESLNLISKQYQLFPLHDFHLRLEDAIQRMQNLQNNRLLQIGNRLEQSMQGLQMLNPHGVLKRGYTYLKTEDGKLIPSFKNFVTLKTGDKFSIAFHDGEAKALKD
jgi:exodeoxyribonuclease VII large subunit